MRWTVVFSSLALLFAVPACAQQPPSKIDGDLTVTGQLRAPGTVTMGGVSVSRQMTLNGNLLLAPNLPSHAPTQHCAIWVNNGVLSRTTCP